MPAAKFDIQKLDFSSSGNAAGSWRKGGFGDAHVAPAMAAALKESPEAGAALSAGLLDGALPREKSLACARKLVAFAAEQTPKQTAARRAVLLGFKEASSELLLVHHLGTLSPAKTKLLVADAFATELSITGTTEWFRLAGKAIRERSASGRPNKTRGRSASPKKSKGLVGEVTELIEAAGTKVATAAGNLADALEAKPEWMGAVFTDIAERAVNEVADFIEILRKTGRPLPAILSSSASQGSLVLKKFVHGALDAGHEMTEIMDWSVTQPGETQKSVLQALIDLGKRLSEMVTLAARKGPAAVRSVSRNLSEIGQTAGAVLAAAASQPPALLETVVQGVLDAGRSLRDMLAAVANMTPDLARGTVQALLKVGCKSQEILAAVAQESASVVREVIAALIAAGRKTGEILEFLIRQTPEVARVMLSALLRSGQSVACLLQEGVKLTKLGYQSVLRAMIGAGIPVGEILMAVATKLNDSIRATVEGMLQIGLRLTDLVRAILTDVIEGFRKDYMESLVASGRAPLDLLKAAAETGPAALYGAVTTFFEIWGGFRALNDRERQEAEAVFGSSVDLSRVRIAAGPVPADIANWINSRSSFTTMYLLNFTKAESDRGDEAYLRKFIRELAHVWQGIQTGPLYLFQSVSAQLQAQGLNTAARSYSADDLARAKGDLRQFNPEQQAGIIEDFWIASRSSLNVAGLPARSLLEPFAKHVFRPLRGRAASRAATEATHVPLAARRSSAARTRVVGGAPTPASMARKTR